MPGISCGFAGGPQAHQFLIYQGATLWVSLGFDQTWRKDNKAAPKAGISHVEALIDTGAEESCIDKLLAAQLGLIPIDRRVVCGVGSMEVDVYLGQIHVPALKLTISGRFAGVPLEENGHRQRVLLGRTFLRYCKLVYDGASGDVTIQLSM